MVDRLESLSGDPSFVVSVYDSVVFVNARRAVFAFYLFFCVYVQLTGLEKTADAMCVCYVFMCAGGR